MVSSDKCSIYYDRYTRPAKIKHCGHTFCETCIRSALASILHCPLDGRELLFVPKKKPRVQHLTSSHVGPFTYLVPSTGATTISVCLLLVELVLKFRPT